MRNYDASQETGKEEKKGCSYNQGKLDICTKASDVWTYARLAIEYRIGMSTVCGMRILRDPETPVCVSGS